MKSFKLPGLSIVCVATGAALIAGCATPSTGTNVVASENAKDKVASVGFLSDPSRLRAVPADGGLLCWRQAGVDWTRYDKVMIERIQVYLRPTGAAFVPGTRIPVTRPTASVTPFEWLFQAFDDPPYGARCEPGLFADFCRTVGLLPHQGIEVLDWVGNPETEPERSEWSDCFDDGKEWWGIWCLTVWNPQQRTLAALVASATD